MPVLQQSRKVILGRRRVEAMYLGGQLLAQWFDGLDLDFASGRYALDGVYGSILPSGLTFSRVGAGTAEWLDNKLVQFATGIPRITNRGFLPEEQRTNKTSVQNANPTSAWSVAGNAVADVVDDSAALNVAGLREVCESGRVIRLTATGPWRIYLSGAAGNTSAHFGSVYWRSADTSFVRRADIVWSNLTEDQIAAPSPTTDYKRLLKNLGPPSAPSMQMSVRGSNSGTYYFILPQLEEGAFATSPIVTEGAAATRGADVASIVVPVGVSTYTATYGAGQIATGAVTPGQVFNIAAAGRPWRNNYLQRLVMQ